MKGFEKFFSLINFLKELNLPTEHFCIFGSAPLAVKGIRDVNDLDVVVDEFLFNILRKKFPNNIVDSRIVVGDITFYKDWPSISIEDIFSSREFFLSLPFASLNLVLEYKKNMLRDKDVKDIFLINNFLSGKE